MDRPIPWILGLAAALGGPVQDAARAGDAPLLLKPARVFDGLESHEGWSVLVQGDRIAAAGPDLTAPDGARTIELPGATLLPGLIDLHTHVLLHPYDETPWDDQVLKEPLGLRVARATNHLRAILDSGFTTVRDLGTEGAGYVDAGLRDAVEQGIITGPRLLATTRAIVATGSYAPRGFAPEVDVPQGAEEADGDRLPVVVRDQIRRGADWVKVYADRWDPQSGGSPTFSIAELKSIVDTAADSGRKVCAHASTTEGMRRAAEAGVATIEHGDAGTADIFALMKHRGVAFVPTLAASEAMARYRGWKPGTPEPDPLKAKRASFRLALDSGVTIANGSDLGVFAHGDGARELELLVDYGMKPVDALRAATATAADVLGLGTRIGRIGPDLQADLIAVEGDPRREIGSLRNVRLVLKQGSVARVVD